MGFVRANGMNGLLSEHHLCQGNEIRQGGGWTPRLIAELSSWSAIGGFPLAKGNCGRMGSRSVVAPGKACKIQSVLMMWLEASGFKLQQHPGAGAIISATLT